MSVANPPLDLSQKVIASHIMLFDCIESLKISSREFSMLKPKLQIFTEYLLRHLQMQNEDLFKVLEENYRRENPQSQMPFFFKAELKELKVRLYSFMEIYLENSWSSGKHGLNRELKELLRAVLERMEAERAYMIPHLTNTQ